ncbi:MAG: hypothetical protein Q4D32_01020 [Eubacteriales bacterium]|nr:hypothetical protein [Eubacteriales bacterium]
MRKSIQKLIAVASASVMALALAVTGVPTSVSAATEVSDAGKAAAKAEFDPAGTYHAYLGLQQTETWIYRDEWYSATLGLNGTSLEEAGLKYDQGTLFKSENNVNSALEGTKVTDAEITGNGVYCVSVEGLNGALTENADAVLAMLYVSTDIPMSAKDNPITISDWKLKLDGNTQTIPEQVFFPAEYTDDSGLLRFDVVNTYQKDQGAYADCPSVVTPNDSIQIIFTVSGMTNDNPDAVEPGTEKASSSSDAASSSSSSESDGGISTGAVVAIVVVVVIVIAAIVVVVTKKKKD